MCMAGCRSGVSCDRQVKGDRSQIIVCHPDALRLFVVHTESPPGGDRDLRRSCTAFYPLR